MSSKRYSYVDLHCHLDLYPDPRAAVEKAAASGVYTLAVTTTPSAWPGTRDLVGPASRIRVGLGLHPEIAHQRVGELDQFEALLPEAAYVGEIGLDGSPQYRAHRSIQVQVFSAILRASARAGGRIMTIHSRRAASEVLDVLSTNRDAGTPILHWFTGSRLELARAVDMGLWFSVGPGMLKSTSGIERIRAIPLGSMLTETDGPFVKANGMAYGPWDVPSIVEKIAALRGMSAEDLSEHLAANLITLLNPNNK